MTTVLALAALLLGGAPVAQRAYLRPPALNEYARHDPSGTTIMPNGRFLRPIGRQLPVPRNPHGLVQSRDGSGLFVASEGTGTWISGWQGGSPTVSALAPRGLSGKPGSNSGGCALSPDGKTLYWSTGDSGAVLVCDVATRATVGEINLNVPVGGRKHADSFAMDLALSADGRWLYAADVTNFRVVVMDTTTRRVVGSVRVGRYPYALSVVGSRLYVANIGMFEYSPIAPPSDKVHDPRGLTYPAFGFPSRESLHGATVEGRKVPGVGDPNVPESFSVWGVDVSRPSAPRVVSRTKTGMLVGSPTPNGRTVGGSAPNFVLARGGTVTVSNGNNDSLELIATASGRIVARQVIKPAAVTAHLRGVGPAGMAHSPDGKRLYVAESGINAIGIFDAATLKPLGHIPTAWYPYRLSVSPDGRSIACICFKGFGNGPSGGEGRPTDPFMGLRGVLSLVRIPADRELPALTIRVLANNGMVDRSRERAALSTPVMPRGGSSQVKYVVFITKENHTYDAVFDRVPGARHDPSLLRWGLHQTIEDKGQPTLTDAAVMTNHNALARQFTVSDNFYMELEASGVGHRWLVGVQPNNFCQMTYTLGWDFNATSPAPGRRASFGSNGSIAPEDYPEAGSMWEHLARHGVPFRNYGEGFEFAGVGEDEDEWKTGAREVVNIPMSKVLFDNTCREFPIFNMNIPDQYRADWFIKDMKTRVLSGKHPMPRFINIAICNDHGTGTKPEKGYPYRASWMADNDLALGRIVEFLSHTPYWKNMAIFVTQDDSGGEPDCVDAQRSVLLAIGPWVRRGYVSHRHTTIPSMHRTLYQLMGLPQLNMFDALANDFSDLFTTKPDYRPYKCVPVDPRIFDPAKARDPKDPDYKQARLEAGPGMDTREGMDDMVRNPGSRPTVR